MSCGDCKEFERIRDVFESFDAFSFNLKKDKYGNYINPAVHEIWVGFKNWFIENKIEQANPVDLA